MSANRKSPTSLVTIARVAPVPLFTSSTLAATTAFKVGSLTVPRTVPVVDWPRRENILPAMTSNVSRIFGETRTRVPGKPERTALMPLSRRIVIDTLRLRDIEFLVQQGTAATQRKHFTLVKTGGGSKRGKLSGPNLAEALCRAV